MITKHSAQKLALAITATILGACSAAQAYEVPLTSINTNLVPVDFHGFISQGFLYSSQYNYLAGETTQGSGQFTEMGVNASWNPLPRTRIAVQGFCFDVGDVGQYDPFLDYALVEYTVNDELGVRAGRIRRPSGIYNSIQDIDLARTYVLLPQGMYDARWRDWSASIDGGELFGNISLQQAGSLTYEAYAGYVDMSNNGGVARYAENAYAPFNITSMDYTPMFGAQLWYNTPLDGLRFGASFAYMSDFGFSGTKPIMAGVNGNVHVVGNVPFQQYSAEYLWKKWTFQAEYYTYDLTGYSHTSIPALNVQNALGKVSDNPQTWYIAASRRINKLLEVGTYYTRFYDGSYSSSDNHQDDATLSFRFDIKDWWIFKVEGHYITGTGLLRDNAQNPVRNDDGWFMLALKTTLSF